MLLEEFANLKTKYPDISDYLQHLEDYLVNRVQNRVRELIPRLAAIRLGVAEAEALGLLMLAEDENLLTHAYRLYCRNSDGVVGEFLSKGDIPDELYCRYCDRNHLEEDELEVEVVFKLRDSVFARLARSPALA